jgi:hypothetical protein
MGNRAWEAISINSPPLLQLGFSTIGGTLSKIGKRGQGFLKIYLTIEKPPHRFLAKLLITQEADLPRFLANLLKRVDTRTYPKYYCYRAVNKPTA